MRQGITYGVCHVRGGGELGEAWRLGGKDANKHHTWDDLIACGDFSSAGHHSKGQALHPRRLGRGHHRGARNHRAADLLPA